MLTRTNIIHDYKDLYKTVKHLEPGKNALNKSTGRFFYDPWEVLPEFKGTSVEDLLNKLPDAGEARVNILTPGESYMAHADIDDRYHIMLDGDYSFLVDLENQKLHHLLPDNAIYIMDTSRIHTASNYGYKNRYQIVVRRLLNDSVINDPVYLELTATEIPYNLRYLFDNSFSTTLNLLNKRKVISEFSKVSEVSVRFIISQDFLHEIEECRKTCGFATEVKYL